MHNHATEKRFPTDSKDYELYEEIGEGVSATVYRALCIPLNEIVAIKVLDLERCNNDLDGIRREVQTMILIDHPNLVRAHCSFTSTHNLWVVMPYMAGGSALHIIKTSFPDGFDEPVIATLLREVLKALIYLHYHGLIHRDVKAGNILLDRDGSVKLGDFGVSACMFDAGDRQRSRNTFVGTPCWMAPEVMQQLHGYDFKADIWSFGITALELAHGHAPFSKYPPMKVLLMTLQNAPPGLDYERDRRFSKAFRDLVAQCLVKDPKKRPSSEKLLKHPFFKHAKSTDYLAKTLIEGLPSLGDRFNDLKAKEANIISNKVHGDMEQLSQQEYIRGISGWNFNLDDIKAQAALLDSSDNGFNSESTYNGTKKTRNNYHNNNNNIRPESSYSESVTNACSSTSGEDVMQDIQDWDGQFSSAFQGRPLQALKSCFDVCEDESTEACSISSPKGIFTPDSQSPMRQLFTPPESLSPLRQLNNNNNNINSNDAPAGGLGGGALTTGENNNMERSVSVPTNIMNLGGGGNKYVEREILLQKHLQDKNHSGPLSYRAMKDPNKLQSAEHSEGTVIEQKGRFKVTKPDVIPKVPSATNMRSCHVSRSPNRSTIDATKFLPSLHYLLQQNATQKEELTKIISCIEQSSGFHKDIIDGASFESTSSSSVVPIREKEMQVHLAQLQQSVSKLTEELQRIKIKNSQMEQQINALTKRK
ncbi:hypothetical protein LUZ60_012832 [Juncus effusus]|nr:hypothetical protein LUZ60_012832 [Juncus effusus]